MRRAPAFGGSNVTQRGEAAKIAKISKIAKPSGRPRAPNAPESARKFRVERAESRCVSLRHGEDWTRGREVRRCRRCRRALFVTDVPGLHPLHLCTSSARGVGFSATRTAAAGEPKKISLSLGDLGNLGDLGGPQGAVSIRAWDLGSGSCPELLPCAPVYERLFPCPHFLRLR